MAIADAAVVDGPFHNSPGEFLSLYGWRGSAGSGWTGSGSLESKGSGSGSSGSGCSSSVTEVPGLAGTSDDSLVGVSFGFRTALLNDDVRTESAHCLMASRSCRLISSSKLKPCAAWK